MQTLRSGRCVLAKSFVSCISREAEAAQSVIHPLSDGTHSCPRGPIGLQCCRATVALPHSYKGLPIPLANPHNAKASKKACRETWRALFQALGKYAHFPLGSSFPDFYHLQ